MSRGVPGGSTGGMRGSPPAAGLSLCPDPLWYLARGDRVRVYNLRLHDTF
jgi:hypothetical protein